MTNYVALLRGIGPGNPSMRNEKLRAVFEDLGFSKVKTVISSGNVIFESPSRKVRELESAIEKALPKKLGFNSTTIIRSKQELQRLADKNPFGGLEHSQRSSLNVTFLKRKTKTDIKFPYRAEDRTYTVLGMYGNAICSVLNLTGGNTPDYFHWVEKKFGKEITTRTWKTVERILKVMD
jgi:uncharacterized protein (DUF1697 family)